MKKHWYNSGVKVLIVYITVLCFVFSIFKTFGFDFQIYLSFMFYGASLWQLVLVLTGHYK
jgi:hypothetical protein